MPKARKRPSSVIGRPLKDGELRILVAIRVAARTHRSFEALVERGRRRDPKYHTGALVDELVKFGRSNKFRPAAA